MNQTVCEWKKINLGILVVRYLNKLNGEINFINTFSSEMQKMLPLHRKFFWVHMKEIANLYFFVNCALFSAYPLNKPWHTVASRWIYNLWTAWCIDGHRHRLEWLMYYFNVFNRSVYSVDTKTLKRSHTYKMDSYEKECKRLQHCGRT